MVVRAGATQEEVRRHNLATLLTLVHVEGATSRAGLTARMGLNRSTIRALTADLVAAGLVREVPGEARTRTGRPSHVVVPESERVFVLAVDVGVAHLVVARVGVGGTVLDRRELAHGIAGDDLTGVVDAVSGVCLELLQRAPAGSVCLGVGVGVPGLVGRDSGLVSFGANLGWVDQPLGARLAARLGLPVRVGNDADVGVLAEQRRGAAVGSDHVVYLVGGVGVGAGIMLDGRPLRGSGGYAGELGHLVVNPQGRTCRCGARGCWETEIGADALLVRAGRPPGGGASAVGAVVAAAAAGEPAAVAALERVAAWLGTGIAAVVNVFNPAIVVIGGTLSEIYLDGERGIRAALRAAALPAPRAQVRLTLPALGADSTLVGAAELAFEGLLRHPLESLTAVRHAGAGAAVGPRSPTGAIGTA